MTFQSIAVDVGKVLSTVVVGILLSSQPSEGKDKKKVPAAPLPAAIVNAKRIFLANGGGSNLSL